MCSLSNQAETSSLELTSTKCAVMLVVVDSMLLTLMGKRLSLPGIIVKALSKGDGKEAVKGSDEKSLQTLGMSP